VKARADSALARRPESDGSLLTRRQCGLGLIALCALAAGGCVSGSAQGSAGGATPSEREREIGREGADEVERTMGLVRDPRVVGYVRDVGQRLGSAPGAQGPSWTFNVVDDEEPNAFSLPAGYCYVSRGLLAVLNSEDELAGVVGHEMGHVTSRHAVRRANAATPFAVLFGVPAAVIGAVSPSLGDVVGGAGKMAGGLVLAPYSRDQEREADRVGMELAAAAGYDPAGLSRSLRTLARAEQLSGRDPSRTSFYSTHPATAERVTDTQRAAQTMTRGSGSAIAPTRVEFVARIDGMVVGPDPASGVFVGSRFFQPELGFAWNVPDGWKTQNTPEAVGAAEGEGHAVCVLQMVGDGSDPAAGARADKLDDERMRRLERIRISGLPAARLITDSRDTRLDLTWIAYGGHIYRIAGGSRAGDFERYRQLFTQSAQSFRPIGDADRGRLTVARLRGELPRQGETLQALVERTAGAWNAEQVAVANGLELTSRLEPGWPVKVPIRYAYRSRGA